MGGPKMPDEPRIFTVQDAQRLLVALHQRAVSPKTVTVAGQPKPNSIESARVRYCCNAVGLEVVRERARQDDPRCPCARQMNHHPELGRAT